MAPILLKEVFDRTVSVKIEYHGPEGSLYSVTWNFGDGSSSAGVDSALYYGEASHTYSTYGNFTITGRYLLTAGGLHSETLTTSVSMSDPAIDPNLSGTITYDAFKLKPIIIPAECTGEIALTAEIGELGEYVGNKENEKLTHSITPYASFASIVVPASGSVDFTIDSVTATSTSGTSGDKKLTNIKNIPAFYDSGVIEIAYTFGSTDDENSDFDVTWDLYMAMLEIPDWMEGNFSTSSQIFKNIISSDNSQVYYPEATGGTTFTQRFKIGSWSEIPPFFVREFVDTPATTIMIKRAMLAEPTFYLKVTNNLPSACTLSTVKMTFDFEFNPSDIFMNMRTEGDRRQKRAEIYTLPKGAEVTRITDMEFPVFAVIDGYKVSTSTRPSEIVKVFAQWNEYCANDGDPYYYPTVVELLPVTGMSGTDYATCLYKSAEYPLKSEDFLRITDGGWMKNTPIGGAPTDRITVLTPQMLANDDHYRAISVRVEDGSGNFKSPDDPAAVFVISTMPNEGIDEVITKDDLTNNIKYIHFFNTQNSFATQITVNRSAISKTFYETLSQTYDKAPVLESVMEEALYFINFTINNWSESIKIRNNQTLKFSDSLTHAADGVRSGDIFYTDGKSPNIINIQNPSKHKYKVKFKCDCQVYKDVYILTDDDMSAR